MKQLKFILILGFFISSCDADTGSSETNSALPQVLETKETSRSYGKGYRNMIDELYEEVLKRSNDLAQMEKNLDALPGKYSDSTAAFNEFQHKNKSYYDAAILKIRSISDSSLRKTLFAFINKNSEQFEKSMTSRQALLGQLQQQQKAVSDLHEAIKVLLTHPLMRDYQKKNLPDARPMERLLREYERIRAKMDSIRTANGG